MKNNEDSKIDATILDTTRLLEEQVEQLIEGRMNVEQENKKLREVISVIQQEIKALQTIINPLKDIR